MKKPGREAGLLFVPDSYQVIYLMAFPAELRYNSQNVPENLLRRTHRSFLLPSRPGQTASTGSFGKVDDDR